tara:strand:- start:437 stop:1198 length:762 start_codon:yes stop_codon:yes gene_type:complete
MPSTLYDNIKVSVITVCYNSSLTILDTIRSVNNQTYKNIEHIFIDGLSSDDTIKIIQNNSKVDKVLVSEKDKGLYDAMNKGVEISKGDYILFLNSDDIFYKNYTVEKIVSCLSKNHIDVLYGDIIFLNRKKKLKRKWVSGDINSRKNWGWHPPHPGLTIKRNIFKEIGNFNIKFDLSADYDFIVRVIKSGNYSFFYLQKTLVKMSTGGVSTSLRGILLGVYQIYSSHRKSGDNILKSMIILIFRYFKKIRQLL